MPCPQTKSAVMQEAYLMIILSRFQAMHKFHGQVNTMGFWTDKIDVQKFVIHFENQFENSVNKSKFILIYSFSLSEQQRIIMRVRYARVSTHEQNLDLQLDELRREGCEQISTDKISGSVSERP